MRVILHSDLNAFYASVECLYRPELKEVPMAVCGDPLKRHGIVLAKNELAKKMGVKTGEAIWEAESKCPGLTLTAPQGKLYQRYSQLVRSIYEEYTPYVEPFGIDECWLDITKTGRDGYETAEELRLRIRREIGLTVSIGVSFNKIFAKLGSDLKKPDAVTEIKNEDFREIVWPLPVRNLLFVGRQTERKLALINIRTIGDLARCGPQFLQQHLGKWGLLLWQSAMGLDKQDVAKSGDYPPVKSVGNSMTAIRDLHAETEVKLIFTRLAEEVAMRLREEGLFCSTVQISLRDNELFSFERQRKLSRPTQCTSVILKTAMSLYHDEHYRTRPLRSLGIRCVDLSWADKGQQESFLPEAKSEARWLEVERTVDGLRSRYGEEAILRGRLLSDKALSGLKSYTQIDLPGKTLPGSNASPHLKPAKIYREVV